ncbi:MAG: hypothetical protein ACRBN8_30615 [Nannocystales bacterium]
MHQRGRWGFFAATLGTLTAVSGCDSVVGVEEPGGSTTEAPASSGLTGAATGADPTPPSGSTDAEPDPGGGTTTGAADDSTGSCLFLACDRETTGVSVECDIFEQNCPDGEKCMPWANDGGSAWNATRCTPVDADPDGLYEPCTAEGSGLSGIDSCELGMMCWSVDPETLVGSCIGMCTGSVNAPTCVDETAYCSVNGDGVVALCLPSCDPLGKEPCSLGEGCYPNSYSFTCLPDASGPKMGGLFEGCEYTNACDPPMMCANPDFVGACEGGAGGCCTPYCDVASPECPEPTSCFSFYEKGTAPPGFENVGICGIGDP